MKIHLYEVLLVLISLVYALVGLVSISALLIGAVSGLLVQNPKPKFQHDFQHDFILLLCSMATLPAACVMSVAVAWSLYVARRYRLATLPLLLPLFSLGIIWLVAGDGISGVLGGR